MGTDVLVTHGPPFGVLDQSRPMTDHLGCEELAETVEKSHPDCISLGISMEDTGVCVLAMDANS